jgi:hypothetical protein
VFGITQLNEEELTDCMNFTNDFHPTVKYTREISVNTINFLDITIINDKETLTTKVHYKPTDSHNYLQFNSFHPKNCKNSILPTKDDDYEDCSTQMISFFTNQGYHTNLLTQAKLKANQHTQQTLLQNSKNATTAPYQIPFVTTYHPEINKIHNILKKNWTILSSTSRFGDCPLLSLRNNANLKKLLVR